MQKQVILCNNITVLTLMSVSSDPSGAQAGQSQQLQLRVCVRPPVALPAHTPGHHLRPEGRKPL